MIEIPGLTPYYQDEYTTLFNADCRLWIDKLPPIDLVICDPPYGMGYKSKKRGDAFNVIKGDDEPFDTEILKKLIGLSRCATYAFCRWNNLAEFINAGVPEPKSFIVWVKNNWTMGDLEHEYARQWEAVAYWCNDGHAWGNGRPTDVIQCDRVGCGDMVHPTQKPVRLMADLIEDNVGDLILDPYAGSCTTLVAAKQLGRHCVGFEINKEFCERGADRLKQGSLFAPAKIVPMEQAGLL